MGTPGCSLPDRHRQGSEHMSLPGVAGILLIRIPANIPAEQLFIICQNQDLRDYKIFRTRGYI